MVPEQLKKFEEDLGKHGYKRYGRTFVNEDYCWCKSFNRDWNPWEEGRAPYQLYFLIYDFSKYEQAYHNGIGVEAMVYVSRTIDEMSKTFSFSLTDQKRKIHIPTIEKKAEAFYAFICNNFAL